MSILDLLGPHEEPQGGLARLAMQLRQQGGPQGLRQALGQGLLGASQAAQESLPTIMQGIQQDPNVGAGGAFAATFVPSLLGSVGAPARRAESQADERMAFQKQLLQEGFRFLSPESQEKVFASIGLPGMKAKRDKDDGGDSAVYRALATQYAQLLADPKSPAADREQAADVLASLDPNVSSVVGGLQFKDPTESTALARSMMNGLRLASTPESWLAYSDPDSPDYQDISKLVPRKETGKGGAGGGGDIPSRERDRQALEDVMEAQKRAAISGRSPNEELTDITAGDDLRASNAARFMGQATGAQTPTAEKIATDIAGMVFAKDPMNFNPKKAIGVAFTIADSVIARRGIPESPRPRQPGGIPPRPGAAPGVGASTGVPPQVGAQGFFSPKEQAVVQAMNELGVAGSDTIFSRIDLDATIAGLDPEVKQQILQRTKQIIGGGGI